MDKFLNGELAKESQSAKLKLSDAIALISYDTKQDLLCPIDYRIKYDRKSSLRSWLNYRMLVGTANIDCDTSPKARAFIEQIYGVKIDTEHGKPGRYYIKDGCVFESDSMHSFKTILMAYVRNNSTEKIQDLYQSEFGLAVPSEFHMLYYMSKNLGTKKDVLANNNGDFIIELELFARLTHSIFNFALVPYCFNVYRGNAKGPYKDFWIKSFESSINENPGELAEKIAKNARISSDEKRNAIRKSLNGYRKIYSEALDNIAEYSFFDLDNSYADFGNAVQNVIDGKATESDLLNVIKNMNNSIIWRGVTAIEQLTGREVDGKDLILRAMRKL